MRKIQTKFIITVVSLVFVLTAVTCCCLAESGQMAAGVNHSECCPSDPVDKDSSKSTEPDCLCHASFATRVALENGILFLGINQALIDFGLPFPFGDGAIDYPLDALPSRRAKPSFLYILHSVYRL